MIKLEYWGSLAELCGKKNEELEASSVAQALAFIQAQYGRAALKEAKRMLITVDGTNILLLERYKTQLRDGQSIAFLPLSAGG